MLPTWAIWTLAGSVLAGAAGVGAGVALVDDGRGRSGNAPSETETPAIDTLDPTLETLDEDGPSVGVIAPGPVVVAITHRCPGDRPVGELRGGDRIVATAVDETGDWVATRDPLAIGDRVWVERRLVVPDDDFGSLPTEPCLDAVASTPDTAPPSTSTTTVPESTTTITESTTTIVSPGAVTTTSPPVPTSPPPTASPTTQAPVTPETSTPPATAPPSTAAPPTPPPPTTPSTTSTSTTSTTSTTTTTTAPDTTGPALSATRSQAEIWETNGFGLCSVFQSEISATATDPSGVASITASWTFAGSSPTRNITDGPTTFGTYSYGTLASGASADVTITIVASDTFGNTTQTALVVTVTSADDCFI